MNYTINYPGQSQPGGPLPVVTAGQRAIVLTDTETSCNGSNGGQQSSYPMMMPIGASNQPVFYTYQTTDGIVNAVISNKLNDNSQVVLSPVSPVQGSVNIQGNANSPNLQAVNICPENKSCARSLGDMFNLQNVNAGQMVQPSNVNMSQIVQPANVNVGQLVQPANVPGTNGMQSGQTEIAKLLSTLHSVGLQIVERPQVHNNRSAMTVPVVNSSSQPSDITPDSSVVNNFITSLQTASIPVVENSVEKTLSISLPKSTFEETSNNQNDSNMRQMSSVASEKMYKIVDPSGHVSLIATGLPDPRMQTSPPEHNRVTVNDNTTNSLMATR